MRSLADQLPRADEAPAWYAFRVGFRKEGFVARALGAEGIECYVPLVTKVAVYKSGRKTVRKPLLPTYLLARITRREYARVLAHPDVSRAVSFNGEITAIEDAEIEFLRRLLADDAHHFDPKASEALAAGDAVAIAGGPLAGTRGEVLSAAGKHNFRVRLQGVGLSLDLVVPAAQIVAV